MNFVLLFLIMTLLTETLIYAARLEDFENCKLTKHGTEYSGNKNNAVSGSICQHWDKVVAEKNLSKSIVNTAFPDSSLTHARNYCRNPTNDPDGPWCYTIDQKKQRCDIPFCEYKMCRHSGPGQEYRGGNLERSSSNLRCRAWLGDNITEFNILGKFTCANPSGDIAGPWCIVLTKRGEEQQSCDIPICDFPVNGKVTVHSEYSIYSDLETKKNMTVGVRLWNPAIDGKQIKGPSILFASQPSPVGATGFEIEVLPINQGGGIILRRWPVPENPVEYDDVVVWKPKRPPYSLAASGLVWTQIWVTWDDDDIRAGAVGLEEVARVSLQIKKEKLQYYSLSGPRSIWDFHEDCEIHSTSDLQFSQLWPIKNRYTGREILFALRFFHSVAVRLYHSPDQSKAVLQVSLHEHHKHKAYLIRNGTLQSILNEEYKTDIFKGDPWQWMHFSINTFGDTLQVLWAKSPTVVLPILETTHFLVSGIRWFSIGSNNTLAHWAVYCKPPEFENSWKANSLECATHLQGLGYRGHQRAAKSGTPCVPWAHKSVPEEFKHGNLFVDGTVEDANNFCRNPDKNKGGPWCFTGKHNLTKEMCNIRSCSFQHCRMAGTGNDYMGNKNTTISGRTCQTWTTDYPHQVKVLNESRFPEQDVEKVENFCRNPDRNITGSWCYTTDPLVPMDKCNIRNCEKEDECTIVTVLSPSTSNIYILPKWKSEGLKFWLKEWDPDQPDGIKFAMRTMSGDEFYLLRIGARHNEAIDLYHVTRIHSKLKKETTTPHIIPTGRWGGFWLKMDTGKIELGFEGSPNAIFKWKDKSLNPITPVLLGIGSIYNNLIGIHFSCDECLTHHYEGTDIYERTLLQENVYPIHLWRPEGGKEVENDPYKQTTFELHARGHGYLMLRLLQFPGSTEYNSYISVMLGNYFLLKTFNKQQISESLKSSMINDEFRTFTFKINETDFHLSYPSPDNGQIVQWHYKHTNESYKNLVYYFIIKTKGVFDWSVNCPPADIDGKPRNGGWSEWGAWNCSVGCDGGHGFRKRTCTNPAPNVFGEYCYGSDIKRGSCNEFPCGKISKETLHTIKMYLYSKHYYYMLEDGDKLNHTCNPPMLQQVVQELENGTVSWTKNGLELNTTHLHNTTTLALARVSSNDTGIYTLVVQGRRSSSTLCVAAVAVLTIVRPRVGERLELYSNALTLETVYSDLKLRWILNNRTWRSYGITPMSQLGILEIEEIEYSHAGIWSCVVTQVELGMVWITAWYHVEIQEPKSWESFLMEDSLTSKLFGPVGKIMGQQFVVPIAAAMLIILILILCTAVAFFHSWRRKQL